MSQLIGILIVHVLFSQFCAAIPLSVGAKGEPDDKQLKRIKGDEWEYDQHLGINQAEDEALNEQDSDCAICEQQFNRVKGITTKCNHTFHKDCLSQWVYEEIPRHYCPICMEQLVIEGYQSVLEFFRNDDHLESLKKVLMDKWGVIHPGDFNMLYL